MNVNIWQVIATLVAFSMLIIVVVTSLKNSIDQKIEEKVKSPTFIRQVAAQLRFPFILFDEDETVLHNSEAELYIEAPIVVKKNGHITEIIITGKMFLLMEPILQALDGKLQFHTPERIGPTGWRYRAFHYEYAAASREEGRPPDRFKLEVIPSWAAGEGREREVPGNR